ncbi:hypothetical protein A1Q2_02559 [Trichosporon asahii var. asahii CBS 8904]|uniref:Uncharacterized protein n=1 Tax=Trichosporon asahii var. asahii (strain CBS 8904) TaxID=1220162 RepID=K1VGA2_TRIAC|nr:hypothetical protein A1Q2_02559 [Trichosporon asahii var. asahii CBS 8904]
MKLFTIGIAVLATAGLSAAAPTPVNGDQKHNWANCHRKRVGGDGSADDPYWCKNNWANCHRKRGYGDGSADDPYWCKNNWANCKRNEDVEIVEA